MEQIKMNNILSKFENSKIYKIVDNTNGNIYIGSTCKTLSQRIASHKYSYKHYLRNGKNYITSFDILANGDFDIILIENCTNITTKDELRARERYFIDNFICVNKYKPITTEQEKLQNNRQYKQANKAVILEKKKKYFEANKAAMLEYQKQYFEANKAVILEKKKQYRQANKSVISEKKKQYFEANKAVILEKKKARYIQAKEAKAKELFNKQDKPQIIEIDLNIKKQKNQKIKLNINIEDYDDDYFKLEKDFEETIKK